MSAGTVLFVLAITLQTGTTGDQQEKAGKQTGKARPQGSRGCNKDAALVGG
jgi:hypothetical protein